MTDPEVFNAAMARILGQVYGLVKAIKEYEDAPGITLKFEVTEDSSGKTSHKIFMDKLTGVSTNSLDEELEKLFRDNGRTFRVQERKSKDA
jgi:hypothetical protein